MKNLILLGAILLLAGYLPEKAKNSCAKKTLESYKEVGIVHNDYCTYASLEFRKHKLKDMTTSERNKKEIDILSNHKPTIGEPLFQNEEDNKKLIEYFSNFSYEKEKKDLKRLVDDLIEEGYMDSKEKEIIFELTDFIITSSSYDEAKRKISELNVFWERQGIRFVKPKAIYQLWF